jgi:hypothetical protein
MLGNPSGFNRGEYQDSVRFQQFSINWPQTRCFDGWGSATQWILTELSPSFYSGVVSSVNKHGPNAMNHIQSELLIIRAPLFSAVV